MNKIFKNVLILRSNYINSNKNLYSKKVLKKIAKYNKNVDITYGFPLKKNEYFIIGIAKNFKYKRTQKILSMFLCKLKAIFLIIINEYFIYNPKRNEKCLFCDLEINIEKLKKILKKQNKKLLWKDGGFYPCTNIISKSIITKNGIKKVKDILSLSSIGLCENNSDKMIIPLDFGKDLE